MELEEATEKIVAFSDIVVAGAGAEPGVGLLSILMECASGQMLALSAHIIYTDSHDVTASESPWAWRKYGHANWLVQRQHNHITFPTPGDAPKNAAAASLYFRGNQIATNSIGRPD